MIRPYTDVDQQGVFKILNQVGGHYMSENQVSFDGFQEVYVFEDDADILGFVALEVDSKISQIICYVSPTRRRQGIGTRLFDYGKERLKALDPNTIWLFFRNDVGESASFYQNRGASPWYAYHYMEGHAHAPTNVLTHEGDDSKHFEVVIPYDEAYFEEYLNIRADAFLDLNRKIDSRPYDERERRDEIEKWCTKNKKHITIFLREGKIIGSMTLFEGFFDEVFVSKHLQTSGIGSAIVNWGLKQCLIHDWKPRLCVVTNNTVAIQLYEKNGFVVKQTLELNRLFSTTKEPDLRGPIGG